MILTTTNQIEGKQISQYHGIISGEVITGVNFIKDFFAGLRDVFGGRSKSYEKELIKAREAALEELTKRAESMGANAVIGIDIDYEVIGSKNAMMMIIATGTAVTIV
ncbi:MAG: YbjQ family protein [Bacteroidales bacterium]|nr:YbjQ family protein [Bacteroidales bacterium]